MATSMSDASTGGGGTTETVDSSHLPTSMDTSTSYLLTTIVTSLTSLTTDGMNPSPSFNTSTSSSAPGGLTSQTTFTSTTPSRDLDNVTATSSPYNYSDSEIEAYLAELQRQTTNIMMPAMVYLLLLAVVGSIGNSLVLFVYSHKFTSTATRIFILVIASFDIITNIMVIPGEIYDMFHIWDFNQPSFCKLRLFFNAFTTMASAMVLVAVAVARYRKICKPFGKQVTITHAKIISTAMTLGCLTFSIPWAIINGRQMKATQRPGIHGYECTLDDSYKNTIWPLLNTMFFILLFLVCCGTILVLYTLIGIQAWRHSHVYGVSANKKPPQSQSGTNDSTDSTEMTSKSGENSLVGILSKTTRSRSYVKKKSGDPESIESAIKTGVRGESETTKPRDCKVKDIELDDVIEVVSDRKEESESGYQARMIRAPTGEKVNINLSMVRELTVKLRAVQKETEQRDTGDHSDSDQESRPGRSVVKFKSVSSDDELCSGDEDDQGRKARKKLKNAVTCKSETREVREGKSDVKCKSKSGSTDSIDEAGEKGGKDESKNGSVEGIGLANSKGGKCKSKNSSMDSIVAAEKKCGKNKSKKGSSEGLDLASGKGGKCKSKNGSMESLDAAGENTSRIGSVDGIDLASGKGGKCKSKKGSTGSIDEVGKKGGKNKSKKGSSDGLDLTSDKCGKCKSKNGSMESLDEAEKKCGKNKSKNGSEDAIHKQCSEDIKSKSRHGRDDAISDKDCTQELSENKIKENGAISLDDAVNNNGLDEEALSDEPLTDFAKAMLWVDITYCLNSDNGGNGGSEEPEAVENKNGGNGLTKKSSFTSSRKISRDNSFLRKHRKMRDALTDTLTRARRSKKEKSNEAKVGESEKTNDRISENVNDEDSDKEPDKDDKEQSKQEVAPDHVSSSSKGRGRGSVKTPARASRRGMGRTTAMLLIISVVYIVGFLPFLALSFYKHYAPESFGGLSDVGLTFYNLFLRSYFLNSAANPIVYSLCDINFRRECLKVLKLG